MRDVSREIYACRAFGTWTRDRDAALLRIFRGGLTEGDPDELSDTTATAYVAMFERDYSCCAIAAGIRPGGIVLITLWTNWESVVSATGGDLRQVLPVRMKAFAVTGSAVHYKLIGRSGPRSQSLLA